jgi:hypothetical protein
MNWYKVRRATPMGQGYVWSTIGHILADPWDPVALRARDLFSNGSEVERAYISYDPIKPQPNSAYAQQP